MSPRVVALLGLVACRPDLTRQSSSQPAPPSVPAVMMRDAAAPAIVAVAPAALGIGDFTAVTVAARAANDRGVGLLKKNQLQEARAAFEQALAEQPTFLLARYNLACVLARSGAPAGARTALEARLRSRLRRSARVCRTRSRSRQLLAYAGRPSAARELHDVRSAARAGDRPWSCAPSSGAITSTRSTKTSERAFVPRCCESGSTTPRPSVSSPSRQPPRDRSPPTHQPACPTPSW